MPSGPFAHVCILVHDLDVAVDDWTKILSVLDPGQVRVCRVPPRERTVQAGAAQQVVIIAPPGSPCGRRGLDSPQCARALGILLEPRVEARPRRGDGFVRDHDGVAIECHQTRLRQLFEHSATAGIRQKWVG